MGKGTEKIAIIGAGGWAREIADIVDACNLVEPRYELLGYIVDPEYGTPGTIINEHHVLGGFDWIRDHAADVSFICGLGASHLRYQMTLRATAAGARYCSLIDPTALVVPSAQIGKGVVVAAGSGVSNCANIRDHVHINFHCLVGHDVVLEEFTTFAGGVGVGGLTTIGAGVYVGMGANIIDRIAVGEWSIVGAGSTVVRDVLPNVTAYGVPARVCATREPGWQTGDANEA